MSHVNRALTLTYWDVLQVKHACFDIPARRITFQDLWRCKVLPLLQTTKLFVECGLDFHACAFHFQIYFHMLVCALEQRGPCIWRWICICVCVCVCVYVWWAVPEIQLLSLSLSLSAILMRLCSNTYKRIACAIYKQSKIIVFDEWANGGLYMHIGCVSCGFRLLLSTCERRCRTEFLAELTGQGLSTL